MPSVELSKLQAAAAARSLSGGSASSSALPASESAGRTVAPPNRGEPRGVSVEVGATIGTALETPAPPVDRERVAEIRKALEEGTYPLVPTRIADAMIAARVSLGMEK
ncbi:MAG: flagellar biosynthesis anti-sigma factor FlgM [Erythrobacter sp.]|jgi:negative regulator of flagellin synthesis FlgM|nr:flagellar biosynthesis anti-sigma factor FlgM [Erythrobacter sp.]